MSMNLPGDDDAVPGLLGDLMKVLGGAGSGNVWLDSAKALAHGVATDGQEDDVVDPLERIALEALLPLVIARVDEATEHLLPSAATLSVTLRSRGAYALRVLDAWAPRLATMIENQAANPVELGEVGGGMDQFLRQMMSTMGPMFIGLQFGSAAGHLARRALTAYALPIPWLPGDSLEFVPANLAAFSEDWSIPLDQVRMLAATREVLAHRCYAIPEVRDRLNAAIDAACTEAMATQGSLLQRLTESGDPMAMQAMLSDPDALLDDLHQPGEQLESATLSAMTTALEAYIDYGTFLALEKILGPVATLREAWRRFRTTEQRGEQATAALFGIDRTKEQVDRGARFVEFVLDRAGAAGLAPLLTGGAALPTPAEVDAPGLWLERLAYGGEATEV